MTASLRTVVWCFAEQLCLADPEAPISLRIQTRSDKSVVWNRGEVHRSKADVGPQTGVCVREEARVNVRPSRADTTWGPKGRDLSQTPSESPDTVAMEG